LIIFFFLQETYNFLLSVEDEILKALVEGAKLSDVYLTAEKYVKKEKPALLDKMTKSLGFVTGIEFRESSLVIGPKNNAIIKKGMVFNINLGFADLDNSESSDERYKKYSLLLSDTVVVSEVSVLLTLHVYLLPLSINNNLISGTRHDFNSVQEANKEHRNLFERRIRKRGRGGRRRG
jgi:nucleosome binding factor SPN SPT16 subunit